MNVSTFRIYFDLVAGRAQPSTDSQRRYSGIVRAALSALAGKGVAVITSLVSVPLTVSYLGTERYGIWLTISSLLAWLNIADFGLGNSLTNYLSAAIAKHQIDEARRFVASSFWMLCALGVGVGVIFLPIWLTVDWGAMINLSSTVDETEVSSAIGVSFLLFVISLPLSIVPKVLGAFQEGFAANIWLAISNVASLVGIILVSYFRGGLLQLAIALSGTVLVVNMASAIWLFAKHKPFLLPRFSAVDRLALRNMSTQGLDFFVLQIAALVLFQTDNLIIAHYLGGTPTAEYSVVYRLFSYVPLLLSFCLTPLWPAYHEAFTRRDWDWIIKTFKRTLVAGMTFASVAVLSLTLSASTLIPIWTKDAVRPTALLVPLIGIWTLMAVWGNIFSFLLNGLGRIRIQATASIFMAIINVILSVVWVQKFGVLGVICGTIVAYGAVSIWIAPLEVITTLRKRYNR